MTQIKNYFGYQVKMQRGIYEKAFFVPDILDSYKIETFIDFGAADGSLINFIRNNNLLPTVKRFIAIEKDEVFKQQLDLAGIMHADSIEEVADLIESKVIEGNVQLNFSSVLHEVDVAHCGYSYSELLGKCIFMLGKNLKIITIRDMCFYSKNLTTDYKVLLDATCKLMLNPTYALEYQEHLKEFEKRCFQNEYKQQLMKIVEFLLKKDYVENFNKEVKENYFNVSQEKLYRTLENSNFEMHSNVFVPDYIMEKFNDYLPEEVINEFYTHIKTIAIRK